MKIGKITLGNGSTSIVVENIEIEHLSNIVDLVDVIAKETRYVSPICCYEKVCDDHPNKCSTCHNRPRKSYYYHVEKLKP